MRRTPVYLVAMPIGDHMEDMSVAAIRLMPTLVHVFVEPDDVVLPHLRKHKVITDKHRVHHTDAGTALPRELVESGTPFAIIASSGIPCFVDPGYEIVDDLLERYADRVELIPIGLSSALDAALTCAGLDIQRFIFAGHYPQCFRFDASVVALDLPIVAFVRGSAVRDWVTRVDAEVPRFRRHLLLRDVRKRSRSAMWVLRKGAPVPDDLLDDPQADFVAVVAVPGS